MEIPENQNRRLEPMGLAKHGKTRVTGVTTLLPCSTSLSTYSAHSRRSYSLLRCRKTSARISWSRWLLLIPSLRLASCNRLTVRACLSWVLVVGNGFTRLLWQAPRSWSDSRITLSALSRIRSRRWSSVGSQGTVDTALVLEIWATRSGWTCWSGWSCCKASFPSAGTWLGSVGFSRLWRLSICITKPCSNRIIEASHQTHCATKTCWVLLA
jgi:hypothetical protein